PRTPAGYGLVKQSVLQSHASNKRRDTDNKYRFYWLFCAVFCLLWVPVCTNLYLSGREWVSPEQAPRPVLEHQAGTSPELKG
ncbi:MAG: hypothetical protein ABF491_15260, partial [Acetobacter sp.]